MNKIKVNIVANYLGTIWNITSIYLFIPFYIKYLGDEGYGVVMISISIQSIILLLDGGFSSVIRRELAWGERDDFFLKKTLNFIKTVEFFYGGIFCFLLILLFLFPENLLALWFHAESLNSKDLNIILILTIVNAVLQMQSSLYNGALISLEFQVLSNLLQFVYSVCKNGVVILVLLFFCEIYIFFIWQLGVTLCYLFIQRIILFKKVKSLRQLNTDTQGKIDFMILKRVWKLSSIFLLLSILSTINLQVDKLIITKILNFKQVGYYHTAYSIGQILVSVAGPVATATIPSIIRNYSAGEITKVTTLFHDYSKFITILIASLAISIYFYKDEIVTIWIHNDLFLKNSSPLISYMIFAGFCLSSQVIPYSLGVAGGKLKPILYLGILNVLITIPCYYFMTTNEGILGTTKVWCISNLFMLLLNVYFYLKGVIPNNYLKWLLYDFLAPLLFISCIGLLFSFLKKSSINVYLDILTMGILFFLLFVAGIVVFFFSDVKKYIKQCVQYKYVK